MDLPDLPDPPPMPIGIQQGVLGKRKRAEGIPLDHDQDPRGNDASPTIKQPVEEPSLADEPQPDLLSKKSRLDHDGSSPELRARPATILPVEVLQHDTELFLSNSSVLIPGLPFAGFTSSFNYVTSTSLRHNACPPNISLTKYYFRTQIQALESTLDQVRSLGEGALAEWYRGLDNRGQSQMADAARFEQWEATVISQASLDSTAPRRMDVLESTSSTASPAHSLNSSAVHSAQGSIYSPNPFSVSTPQYLGGQLAPALGSSTPSHIPFQSLNLLASHQSPHRRQFPLGSFSPMSVGSQTGTAPTYHRKPEKSFQEVIKLKAERRSEIERRCLDLEPPIKPSTLTFMDAFNAAVQIPIPLNDNAWEALKPRLLAQLPAAKQEEAKNQIMISTPDDASLIQLSKTDRHPLAELDADQLWEEIKRSPREKIKTYADEYISSIWAEGKSITKATVCKFAADALVHIRRRFYETLMEEEQAIEAKQIVLPPDSLPDQTRKLKLEDMRWIFQEAIRPHTEHFSREIFLCSACDTGTKRFSFDAVIQHYAAKHTSALSHGNAVVHWKAEWPAEPPFHPTPDTIWNQEASHRPMFGSQTTSSQYIASPPYFLTSGPSWTSPMHPARGQPSGLYATQSDALISAALDVWAATDQIYGLPDSVRLYVIIHQVIMRLSQRFANEVPLSMFADCISHKPALRQIRFLANLQCKSCLKFGTFGKESGHNYLSQNSSRYVVPELLDHFQKTHLEPDARSPSRGFGQPMSVSSVAPPCMDWKFDMIELPHENAIRDLIHAPGMNLQKLEVIATALPLYFPHPLPPIEPIPLDILGPSRKAPALYGHALEYQEPERRIRLETKYMGMEGYLQKTLPEFNGLIPAMSRGKAGLSAHNLQSH
ncbi:hypothetical protein DV738_g3289, partial [Chaetothyriales sp. CBS 135597]